MKICKKCLINKSLNSFSCHPTTKDRLQNVCKACASFINKERYIKNKTEILQKTKKYREENRETILLKKREWYKENSELLKKKSSQWYFNNKDKARIQLKKWREQNREKMIEYNKKYVLDNIEKRRITALLSEGKRRSKMKIGNVSKDIRNLLGKSQNWECAICHVDLNTVKIHLDHIHPISKGGLHSDNNLQLLCSKCNLCKSSKPAHLI